MFETSIIEIDAEKYRSNLRFLQKTFGPEAELCLVIKGNAYGHGEKEIMNLALDAGIRTFGVFSAKEALRVIDSRREGTRLIITGDIDFSEIEWAIENDFEFHVNNPRILSSALDYAKRIKKKAKIHIEFETGMNRLGFEKDELAALAKCLRENRDHFELKGFCTHLAGAESFSNFPRVKNQVLTFDENREQFREQDLVPEQNHAACSAAAIRFPTMRYEMVRIGILQFGYWPNHETYVEYIANSEIEHDPLKPVMTWKSRVMSTKNVAKGEYVGYGNAFLANADRQLAVIPVGYSDGFSRSLSNQGRVLVRGCQAPVVGTVNMNALTVDVTDIPGIHIGDEVVLIGRQGDQSITVASFSDFSNQLNYELLSRLPPNIPRLII